MSRCLAHNLCIAGFSQIAASAGGYGVGSLARRHTGRLMQSGHSMLIPNLLVNLFQHLWNSFTLFLWASITLVKAGGRSSANILRYKDGDESRSIVSMNTTPAIGCKISIYIGVEQASV
jgi:hypothetical protein